MGEKFNFILRLYSFDDFLFGLYAVSDVKTFVSIFRLL